MKFPIHVVLHDLIDETPMSVKYYSIYISYTTVNEKHCTVNINLLNIYLAFFHIKLVS